MQSGLLVGTSVADDSLLYLMVGNQFAVSHLVIGGIVSNDSEVLNTFFNNGVDNLGGAAVAQETAKHNCHTVLNFLDGLLQCDLFVHNVYVLEFIGLCL